MWSRLLDFHVCVCARARCDYRCMCVLVSAGGVEWTSGSPREALAERAAGGACARPDPARTDRGPACPFPRAPAGSSGLAQQGALMLEPLGECAGAPAAGAQGFLELTSSV